MSISDCTGDHCSCENGWYGLDCTQPDCSAVSNCSDAGFCVKPQQCECYPGYFGRDCSQCAGPACQKLCDFDCIHGRCDSNTRSCLCNEGWTGAACDVCTTGSCQIVPVLTLILPQAAEIGKPGVVYAHGKDLPKGDNNRYNCLFGGMATEGRWLSSTLIRCPIPPRAHVGKHAFNLVPLGSNNFIPYDIGRLVHFTFYLPCKPEECGGGHCLGPMCVCDHSRTGAACDAVQATPSEIAQRLEDPMITQAKEFTPYTAVIPID
ncbi:EGF-like domain containing protein, partial [Aphelenchoides avenae]